ncbi:MAG: 2-oxoacid:acceptor oxidoreductase family protein [Nitrospirota bacterium]
MERRVIIAGSGGQGILFLGRLMAHAALLDGREVTWFPSYGAEMRGGTANCTVVISDAMIGSPVVRNPDILIAMNQASFHRFSSRILPGGIVLYDLSLVAAEPPRGDIEMVPVPASELAASLNSTKSANMVMMGAFSAATGAAPLAAICAALEETTPRAKRESLPLNKELITKGYRIVEHKKGACN